MAFIDLSRKMKRYYWIILGLIVLALLFLLLTEWLKPFLDYTSEWFEMAG